MAKVNFTKVEEILSEGMRKLSIQKIVGEDPKSSLKKHQKILKQLVRNVNVAMKRDRRLFSHLGYKKEEIQAILTKPELSQEDWKYLMDFNEKFELYKAELAKKTTVSDDKQVENEIIKHINKRFNVNDNWLPLK